MRTKGMIGIYGANGFIGRHLIDRLKLSGRPLRAVSRQFDPGFRRQHEDEIEFATCDLRDSDATTATLQGVETVVQLISTSTPAQQNHHAVADIRENVIPHVDFLQAAVDAGVRRYIFLSSGGTVYGAGAETPTREDAPTNPISSHALTKLTIEKYLQMHGHVDQLDYVILRVANPFGPGQTFRKGQGLIPAVLALHRNNQPVRIMGDGGMRRDFIYIDDLIDAVDAVVRRDDVRQTIINLGSGESRSVLEVIEAIEGLLGVRFKREYVEMRSTDVDISVLNIDRARELLGWAPRTGFHDGLLRTLLDWSAGLEASTVSDRLSNARSRSANGPRLHLLQK